VFTSYRHASTAVKIILSLCGLPNEALHLAADCFENGGSQGLNSVAGVALLLSVSFIAFHLTPPTVGFLSSMAMY
jgi:hypothetical protein